MMGSESTDTGREAPTPVPPTGPAWRWALIDHAPDVVTVLEPDGRIRFGSPSVERVLGHKPKDLVGQSIYALLHPDDRERGRVVIDAALAHDGLSPATELRVFHQDGEWRWIEILAERLILGDGSVISGVLVTSRDVTERRLSEEALRTSESLYRSAVTAMEEGIIVQDANGVIRACNASAQRILGFRSSDVLGVENPMKDREPMLRENGEPFAREEHPAMVALRSGEAQSCVLMGLPLPSGAVRWISVNSRPLADGVESSPGAVVTSILDVTERKQAEDSLRRSAELYRLLAENSSDVICRFSPRGRLLYTSPACKAVLGVEPAELVGSRALDLVHPDDVPQLAALREEGDSFTVACRICRKDNGRYVWVESTGRRLRSPLTGEITEVLGVVRDISGRKRAEDHLRRSEENFRALIEGLANAVLVHQNGVIVYVNPAGRAYLGYAAPNDLLGVPLLSLVHIDDRDLTTQRLERDQTSGERPGPEDMRLVCRDGHIVVAEVTSMPVVFDGAASILTICRDLTERKGMLAQLRMSERLASVGTLAAGVAHELNNPLAYIINNLAHTRREIARLAITVCPPEEEKAFDDLRSAIDEAEQGAGRMGEIIRGLKTFARGDDSRRELVDVEQALESAIRLSWSHIRHRAKLTRSYVPAPRIMGSGVKLEQVFVNLLINAAQALPDGRPGAAEISVAMRLVDDRVVVEVSDTGCGIPQEDLPCIFDPFFSTKPIGVGTGLGLSICHGIVSSLGGEISVGSELGKGTTFRVSLPAAEEPQHMNTIPPRSTGRAPRSKVLVIDDDALVARSVRRLLGRTHDVTVAGSGAEALEFLAAGRVFDVIFCDLMMPGMTGMDFHQELLRSAPEVALRVVFATGGAFTPRAQEFLEGTNNLRVEKPFDLATLERAIRSVVSDRPWPAT